MAGHSRPEDGVASARLCPAIHVFTAAQRTWMPGRPGMTTIESPLMDSLNPEHPPVAVTPALRGPLIWEFWGTALWGLFVFAALFVGQIAVVVYFVLRQGGPIDVAAAVHVVAGGLTISLSVLMGLPAVVAALWLPIHLSRTPFADYLA